MESSGAASFFGDDNRTDAAAARDASEAAFEERAVRALLKKFGVAPAGALDRLRFGPFDEAYPSFPVRLSAERIKGRALAAADRKPWQLGFHELTPATLFKPEQFAKTAVYRAWEALKEDGAVDRRAVGLVFPGVGLLYAMHDWAYGTEPPDRAFLVTQVKGHRLTVELFDSFLTRVAEGGWTASR